MLWGIAQILLIPNRVAGPLALVLVFGMFALRVPRKERATLERCGGPYRRYMDQTERILSRRQMRPDRRPA